MNLSLYYHTIRPLRWRQIAGQLNHRVLQRLENPAAFLSKPIPTFPGFKGHLITPLPTASAPVNSIEKIISGKMTFLNITQDIGWPPAWNRTDLPKLWLYNLHYFDWLQAFAEENKPHLYSMDTKFNYAKEAVLSWIASHGLKRNQVGWQSYQLSLRLINWCIFFFYQHWESTQIDSIFLQKLWASIFLQAEWLSHHIEYSIMGNHILENAAALAYAGACFDGTPAERWLKTGSDLLRRQIREQILPDGLHFERSPMYQCRIIYLFLTLYNTNNSFLKDIVGPLIPKMLDALPCVTHPDGRIALLNDSAFGIYNEPKELLDYAAALGITPNPHPPTGPFALPNAGLFGFRDTDGNFLICDAGPVGPDYIPGHAHADTFSFELSLNGRRLIVDTGIHDYEHSLTRSLCRATKAHNTVEINQQDQSEMWAAFRVARRGLPHDVVWLPNSNGFELSAWHDGYRRLPGRPIHRRSFTYLKGGNLKITDCVETSQTVHCRSFLHLHPDCHCSQLTGNVALIQHPAGQFKIEFAGTGSLSCSKCQYHPEFNSTQANSVLIFSWFASPGKTISEFTIQKQL